MTSERDVYHVELSKLGHGLPVYEPDPAGEFDKVRVRDVGYVDRFGRFHRVFNAFLPREHPINVQRGTPEGYAPLQPNSSETFCRSALPAGAMHSAHVRVLEGDFGVSGSSLPVNTMITFSVSNHQGAALVIKHPAFREDILYERDLAAYMLQNYRSRITFMRDVLGCLISLHNIVLVTGCDLTADWATATFVEKASQCQVEFKAGDPTQVASGTAAFWGTWQSSINVPHRCGPRPVRPPAAPIANRAVDIAPFQDTSLEGPIYNQCIFLRGFRVRERKLRAPRIIKAAADPEDLDMDRDGDVAPLLTSLEQDSESASDEYSHGSDSSGYDASQIFIEMETIHDILLNFILEHSDADVALIHDSDVCQIVKYADENLDGLPDSRILKSCFSIETHLDVESRVKVGRVVGKDKGHLSSNACQVDNTVTQCTNQLVTDSFVSACTFSVSTKASDSPSLHFDSATNCATNIDVPTNATIPVPAYSVESFARKKQQQHIIVERPTKAYSATNHNKVLAKKATPTTVPCQYRTGKTLGSRTDAVVKEAVHIRTGKYYACKVINKKLREGREFIVRNEIAVLKRVSKGHKNIVTLHDYFETTHNHYLCFDLCTGGELFDRICAKGNYSEAHAAKLVRTVMKAVDYIHDCGIVHRDLKPENLLFRTKAEDADIMIADFGFSRIMDKDKLQLLTGICGTPNYMAPEIFKKSGYGKPVDVWAMGVITYFLLCGYTPFDRDSQELEMQAILKGDYAFGPEEYWAHVSETARDFVRTCLTADPAERPTAKEVLEHRWLASEIPHFVADPKSPTGVSKDLLPTIQKGSNARKTSES